MKEEIVMQTISGIMVDGVKVGESITSSASERYGEDGASKDTYITHQDFRDADMVAILRKPFSADGKPPVYTCYGIFGNIVVNSTISLTEIKNKNKNYIWCIRKPYILNGDLHNN